jgi:single-strand DNA-binding protein
MSRPNGDNELTFAGNLTSDPVLRHTRNGTSVVNGRIASSRSFQDNNGEWQDVTTFLSFSMFGASAENFVESDSAQSGMRVLILGQLEPNKYEKDGVTIEGVQIMAREIALSTKYHTHKGSAEKIPRATSNSGGGGGGGNSGGGNSGGGNSGGGNSGGGNSGGGNSGGGNSGGAFDAPPPPSNDDVPF